MYSKTTPTRGYSHRITKNNARCLRLTIHRVSPFCCRKLTPSGLSRVYHRLYMQLQDPNHSICWMDQSFQTAKQMSGVEPSTPSLLHASFDVSPEYLAGVANFVSRTESCGMVGRSERVHIRFATSNAFIFAKLPGATSYFGL